MTTAAGIGIVGSLLLTPLIGEAGGGIALLLALLAALSVTGERLISAAQDRARAAPLLEWATTRPGQLGRGVPGSAPLSTVGRALDPLAGALFFIGSVSVLIGGFFLVVVVAVLSGIGWMVDGTPFGWFDTGFVLALVAAVVVPVVAGGLLLGLWRMSSRAEQRRAGALEWLVAPGEDEAQPRR